MYTFKVGVMIKEVLYLLWNLYSHHTDVHIYRTLHGSLVDY